MIQIETDENLERSLVAFGQAQTVPTTSKAAIAKAILVRVMVAWDDGLESDEIWARLDAEAESC